MSFEAYLNQAWADHATQSQKVAEEFGNGLSLVSTTEQLVQITALITHVMGEHLGQWNAGISILDELRRHPAFDPSSEAEQAIRRSTASLQICAGQTPDLSDHSLSDQVRILTLASSALSEKEIVRSEEFLRKALSAAETGLQKQDPANRALAIAGNNLACTLEEKTARSAGETSLMILAAQAGRKYWELAGGWREVERAEYRLASSYLQAGDHAKALNHAQACIEICRDNNAEDLELFFGYEALARVEKARANDLGFQKAVDQATRHFKKLHPDDKTWCEPSLKRLK